MDDREYLYLTRKVLELTSINLDNYKSQQMRRRLDTFVSHTQAKNIVEYTRMIKQDQNMLKEFRDFLTINVSEFFRDPSPFEQLRALILPQLLKNTPRLNIWSAGCSCGEEAYSVAMILENISPYHTHRILATDIDEGVLKKAKAGGPYSPNEIKSVSPILLKRYFTSSNGDYMVINRIKQRIEFRQQNLLCDEFEQGFDLIICRNVTIYFTEEAKRELNQRFYHSLKDVGVLFIGGTEVMLDATNVGFKGLGVSFYQKSALSTSRGINAREGVLPKI